MLKPVKDIKIRHRLLMTTDVFNTDVFNTDVFNSQVQILSRYTMVSKQYADKCDIGRETCYYISLSPRPHLTDCMSYLNIL